jgi:hypothetical protein
MLSLPVMQSQHDGSKYNLIFVNHLQCTHNLIYWITNDVDSTSEPRITFNK